MLEQPGNLFNLTEGALWGTLPERLGRAGTPADLDGDGKPSSARCCRIPACSWRRARASTSTRQELDAAGEDWEPTASDAFTAIVVMVPTMSEYFGQWKVSRFVAGDRASSESFNVVSRLSDIRDILTGLEVIYEGVEPADRRIDEAKAAQTGRELTDLRAFIAQLYDAGAGREALHGGAGRHARNRGAGARDGDRRAGLAGGGAARCRDRAVASRRSPALVAALVASCRARRSAGAIRDLPGGWQPTCGRTSPTPSGR